MDFSKGKKLIKEFVDGPGRMDHTLWLPGDSEYWQRSLKINSWEDSCFLPLHKLLPEHFFDNLPDDLSLCEKFDAVVKEVLKKKNVELKEFLLNRMFDGLGGEYGDSMDVRLDSSLITEPLLPRGDVEYISTEQTFRYTHGLPRSTSYGCQNMVHGHYSSIRLGLHHKDLLHYVIMQDAHPRNIDSIVELVLDGLMNLVAGYGLKYIPKEYSHSLDEGKLDDINDWSLQNLHFYNGKDYSDEGTNHMRCKVGTLDRGLCEFRIAKEPMGDWVETDVDTTVENLLVGVFEKKLHDVLDHIGYYGSYRLELTEGMSKGGAVHGKHG